MIIDLNKFKNNNIIDINEEVKIDDFSNTSIIELIDTKVIGTLTQSLVLDISIEGTMILPCAVTLKPVKHKFIAEVVEQLEENSKNSQNTIDIFSIIWENILMEIPLRVVSDDLSTVTTEGEGWKLVTEGEVKLNPELQKLKDLL